MSFDLYFYKDKPNFGDALNPWFWGQYLPIEFQSNAKQLIFGIGTLINNDAPIYDYERIHILGSGAGYGSGIPKAMSSWNVHCVRGPLTASAIGVDKSLGIADPAILINELVDVGVDRGEVVAFMPHHGVDSPRLRKIITDMGLLYISPEDDYLDVIETVNKCGRMICSAMHGAILAEALRIPWCPISTSSEILEFKWNDWFQSMELDLALISTPSIWPTIDDGLVSKVRASAKEMYFKNVIKKLLNSNSFYLAKETVLNDRKMRIKEKINDFISQFVS